MFASAVALFDTDPAFQGGAITCITHVKLACRHMTWHTTSACYVLGEPCERLSALQRCCLTKLLDWKARKTKAVCAHTPPGVGQLLEHTD